VNTITVPIGLAITGAAVVLGIWLGRLLGKALPHYFGCIGYVVVISIVLSAVVTLASMGEMYTLWQSGIFDWRVWDNGTWINFAFLVSWVPFTVSLASGAWYRYRNPPRQPRGPSQEELDRMQQYPGDLFDKGR
jgi:hypothetical protein